MNSKDDEYFSEPELDEWSEDPRIDLALRILKQTQDSLQNVVQLLQSGSGDAIDEAVQSLDMSKQALDTEVVARSDQVAILNTVIDSVDPQVPIFLVGNRAEIRLNLDTRLSIVQQSVDPIQFRITKFAVCFCHFRHIW